MLYSFLPHKELRFLFPIIPLFNAVSAIGLSHLLKQGELAESVSSENGKRKGREEEDKARATDRTSFPLWLSKVWFGVSLSVLNFDLSLLLWLAVLLLFLRYRREDLKILQPCFYRHFNIFWIPFAWMPRLLIMY